jgi:hypothetical protein
MFNVNPVTSEESNPKLSNVSNQYVRQNSSGKHSQQPQVVYNEFKYASGNSTVKYTNTTGEPDQSGAQISDFNHQGGTPKNYSTRISSAGLIKAQLLREGDSS